MCVAVPAEILDIAEALATVAVGGARLRARLELVPEAQVGDWVLLHAGVALQVMDAAEAQEILALLEEARLLG